MYPVISLLRRYAVAQIYVRPTQLQKKDGRYWIALKKPSNWLDLESKSWTNPDGLAPMFVLKVEADSSEAAAIALTKKENDIAAAIRAHETFYTIVMGPESETVANGKFTRVARLTIIRGVFRSHGSNGTQLEQVTQKKQIARQYSKIPKGAIFDKR